MKKIAVVDGLGGGLGAQIVSQLKAELGGRVEIYALGTNANATERMVRAGADRGATGENAIRVSIDTVDFIVAPIGVIIPDAMMGEITPRIARSVFRSRGEKILVPLVQQHFTIAGFDPKPIATLISQAVELVKMKLDPLDAGSS